MPRNIPRLRYNAIGHPLEHIILSGPVAVMTAADQLEDVLDDLTLVQVELKQSLRGAQDVSWVLREETWTRRLLCHDCNHHQHRVGVLLTVSKRKQETSVLGLGTATENTCTDI